MIYLPALKKELETQIGGEDAFPSATCMQSQLKKKK